MRLDLAEDNNEDDEEDNDDNDTNADEDRGVDNTSIRKMTKLIMVPPPRSNWSILIISSRRNDCSTTLIYKNGVSLEMEWLSIIFSR